MKIKQIKQWILVGLLVFAVEMIAGCAGHADESPLHPIDAAVWPTPVAAQPTPRFTPFPKISLEAAYAANTTPAAVSAEVSAADASGEFVAATQDETVTTKSSSTTQHIESSAPAAANPSAVAEDSSLPAADLPRITDGQVIVSAVNVRQGPGPAYSKLDILQLGQVVDVLATNPNLDWVLVQSGDRTGWVSLDYIDLFDEVEILPVLSPDSLLPTKKESGAKSQGLSPAMSS